MKNLLQAIIVFFTLLLFSSSKETSPFITTEDDGLKECASPDSNNLIVYTWYVPDGEGCCTGKASKGSKSIYKPNEGITRTLEKTIPMDAKTVQVLRCKK